MISSPDDLDARSARQDTPSWVGDTVHVTETCEADAPSLITDGDTTAGPIADAAVTSVLQDALHTKRRLPRLHIVDTGDLEAEWLVTSQRAYGVELLGPTRPDDRWQARAGQGFDAGSFVIDWEQRQARCPVGRQSSRGTPVIDSRHHAVIKIKVARHDCQPCPSRLACTRATRRTITVRPHADYLGLQAARRREQTAADHGEYAKRAGSEATISHAVRGDGVRRARYVGALKTHLQHVLTAAAMNFVRVGMWLGGHRPAKTRQAAFVALMTHTTSAA